ncbi:MAG: YgjV family protein [Clostridia bacterium]|nr:YgjV family protein [Clostridia bacterium]
MMNTALPWIAQIFGMFGMIALFWSYQQNQRKRLIAGKLAADVMWVTHYLMLSAVGGAIPNFVGIFRELVFMNRDKKWASLPVWPVIFILINWTLALSKASFPLSFLPIGASTFVTISLWAKKPKVTRWIGAGVSAAFIIYDCFVHSWIGIINESVALISIFTALVREYSSQKEKS